MMYASYAGKARTDSNIAWHRPQSNPCRVEQELMEKSAHALANATNPVERMRLLCLSRGASSILIMGRVLRSMDVNGTNHLDKEDFLQAIKDTGLDMSDEDVEALFAQFNPDGTGSISIDEFINAIRYAREEKQLEHSMFFFLYQPSMEDIKPPMNDGRREIVAQAFRKLDKHGEGYVSIEDLRGMYSVDANPRYKSGEESKELIMGIFLANFETEGIINGKVTMEDFMNYYSGISVSIESDCNFDLVMRQCYKL